MLGLIDGSIDGRRGTPAGGIRGRIDRRTDTAWDRRETDIEVDCIVAHSVPQLTSIWAARERLVPLFYRLGPFGCGALIEI